MAAEIRRTAVDPVRGARFVRGRAGVVPTCGAANLRAVGADAAFGDPSPA